MSGHNDRGIGCGTSQAKQTENAGGLEKSHLRLFLSMDFSGSTALKNRYNHNALYQVYEEKTKAIKALQEKDKLKLSDGVNLEDPATFAKDMLGKEYSIICKQTPAWATGRGLRFWRGFFLSVEKVFGGLVCWFEADAVVAGERSSVAVVSNKYFLRDSVWESSTGRARGNRFAPILHVLAVWAKKH